MKQQLQFLKSNLLTFCLYLRRYTLSKLGSGAILNCIDVEKLVFKLSAILPLLVFIIEF